MNSNLENVLDLANWECGTIYECCKVKQIAPHIFRQFPAIKSAGNMFKFCGWKKYKCALVILSTRCYKKNVSWENFQTFQIFPEYTKFQRVEP